MTFERAFSLARYNWPLYLACFLGMAIGFSFWAYQMPPFGLRCIGLFAGVISAWYAVASFAAFHVMFDRPDFLSGTWLSSCVPSPPRKCVHLRVCADETRLPISTIFPHAEHIELELFDESVMTEPAIARARQQANKTSSLTAKPEALPLPDNVSDLTVVTLAAHEVRDPQQREKLFQELSRVTEYEGRLVIVEHLRNLPAALAFGPGLFHFYPRTTWIRLAKDTQLVLESEFDVTPFFHVFVLRHA